jgi:histidine triad (HIT) family protein
MSMDCIFCKILAGTASALFLHRDELCAAFMDIQPVNTGHLLVIPNVHAANLAELDPETGGRIFQVGQRLAAALRQSGLPCEGVNFFLADGHAAGQEVFHLHLHVWPRYAGDGFGFRFGPHYRQRPGREALEAAAETIRRGLGAFKA